MKYPRGYVHHVRISGGASVDEMAPNWFFRDVIGIANPWQLGDIPNWS